MLYTYNIMKKASPNKYLIPNDFSERVRRLRIRYELTQTRIAELMGVSFATVNRWENGQSKPSKLASQQILRVERYGLDALSKDFEPHMSIKEPDGAYGEEAKKPIVPEFTADPEIVRLVAEGHRLKYGHLYNPAFHCPTKELLYMNICCLNSVFVSSLLTTRVLGKLSWLAYTSGRCWLVV